MHDKPLYMHASHTKDSHIYPFIRFHGHHWLVALQAYGASGGKRKRGQDATEASCEEEQAKKTGLKFVVPHPGCISLDAPYLGPMRKICRELVRYPAALSSSVSSLSLASSAVVGQQLGDNRESRFGVTLGAASTILTEAAAAVPVLAAAATFTAVATQLLLCSHCCCYCAAVSVSALLLLRLLLWLPIV